jgi:hypothetical protein
MDAHNHYEAAFGAYLRRRQLCYVAVNETRRSQLGEARLKSLDFIVHGERGARLLVDVKGRRFPAGSSDRPRRVWECWATQEDVDGLERWAELFGRGWQGLLVFAYELRPDVCLPEATPDLCELQQRRYLFRAVRVRDYRLHMRVRSPRWGTVGLPCDAFRRLVRPVCAFTRSRADVPHEPVC